MHTTIKMLSIVIRRDNRYGVYAHFANGNECYATDRNLHIAESMLRQLAKKEGLNVYRNYNGDLRARSGDVSQYS